jgi:hypothetical protein
MGILRKGGRDLVVAAVIAVVVVALALSSAAADVGRFEVRPQTAVPGSSVELSFAAAWSQRFPVSLVSLARVPEPFRCHGGAALCAPVTQAPPRRRPFVFLGSARPDRDSRKRYIYDYRFRFVVPDVKPGAYAFVLWCDGCYEGPRGSLITSALPSSRSKAGILRIDKPSNPLLELIADLWAPWAG